MTVAARTLWIDVAKAFAIFFVVFGHVWRGIHDAGLLADARVFAAVDNAIYLFHMPLFFFLSGLTFSGTRHAWPDFLRRLGRSIVLPYVIWSVALVAVKQGAGGTVNHPVGFADLLGIAYAPISPFWFFYALFLIQITARLCLPRVGLAGTLALAILGFLAHFLNPNPGTPIDFALEFLPYFALGLLFQPLRARPPRVGPAGALTAGLLFLGPPLLCLGWSIGYETLPGRIAAVPMILAASAFCLWFAGTAAGSAWPIVMAGRATLAIYCLHIFFTGTTRAVLMKLGVVDVWPQLLVATLLGMIAPIMIQRAATRFGVVGWLGFPPLPAAPNLRAA